MDGAGEDEEAAPHFLRHAIQHPRIQDAGGSEVLPERDKRLRKEYLYYCPECDEDMYSFECVETCVPDGVKGV